MKKAVLLLFVMLLITSLSNASEPSSWKDQIFYFVLLDRFSNGEKSNDSEVDLRDPFAFHGGDLRGLIKRLDYLERLGITGIWLSPVFQNREPKFFKHSSYHGYWPWDFWNPDPRFGTFSELEELRKETRKKQMRLLLDVVVNHMGYDAEFAVANPDWFNQNGNIEDWNDEFQLLHHNIFGLPDFASEKPVVKKFFKLVGRHWLQKVEPDGFRLDAVKHVPLEFWRDFNAEMRQAGGQDFMLLGEYLHGDPVAFKNVWRQGDFTSLFDFPLYYTIKEVFAQRQSCLKLASRLYFDRNYPDGQILATFVDNHDLDRFYTLCDENPDRYMLALTFIMTVRGIPVLCYGDEQGLTGHEGPKPLNRGDMVFDEESALFKKTQRLIKLRKENLPFRRGLHCHLFADDTALAYARLTPDAIGVTVINNSDQPRQLVFPFPFKLCRQLTLPDLLGSAKAIVRQGQFEVFLPAYGCAVFVPDSKPEFYADAFRHWQRHLENEKAWGTRLVKFKVKFDYVPEKVQVFLTGNCKEIGNWSPDRGAVPMVRISDDEFEAEVKLPLGRIVECKCFFKQLQEDETNLTVWQNENNRIFEVRTEGSEYVHLSWRTLPEPNVK